MDHIIGGWITEEVSVCVWAVFEGRHSVGIRWWLVNECEISGHYLLAVTKQ